MKYTDWFTPDVKPVHPGVYQVKSVTNIPFYRKWDGTKWFAGASDVRNASRATQVAGWDRSWRGLASPDGE